MYSVSMGIINNLTLPVENYSAVDKYDSLEEALKAFHRLDKDYIENFLDRDLGIYESDTYVYKELQDEQGVIMYRTSYPINKEE